MSNDNTTQPYTFTIPIAPDKLSALRDQLTKSGFPIPNDTGEIEYRGIKFRYSYTVDSQDGNATGNLEIAILHKGFIAKMVSNESIEQQVRDHFKEA
jgi:hypothetical protein